MAQATPRAPLGTRGGVRKKWFHQSRRSVGVRIQWVEQALPTTTAGSSAPTMAQPAHQAGSLGMVPPSMPYEQWRAGYDNACEEARRSCRTPTQLAAESSSSNPATDAVYSQHTRRAAAADLALLMPRESIAKMLASSVETILRTPPGIVPESVIRLFQSWHQSSTSQAASALRGLLKYCADNSIPVQAQGFDGVTTQAFLAQTDDKARARATTRARAAAARGAPPPRNTGVTAVVGKRAGLKFLEKNCGMEFHVRSPVVARTTTTRKQLPPAVGQPAPSLRVIIALEQLASSTSFGIPLRAHAAAWALAALACSRTVNFRRARIVNIMGEFATASALDKGPDSTSMAERPIWLPTRGVTGAQLVAIVRLMTDASPDTGFFRATDTGNPATATSFVYAACTHSACEASLRACLEAAMPGEDTSSIHPHGFRHFLAEIAGHMEMPDSDANEVGRWALSAAQSAPAAAELQRLRASTTMAAVYSPCAETQRAQGVLQRILHAARAAFIASSWRGMTITGGFDIFRPVQAVHDRHASNTSAIEAARNAPMATLRARLRQV